MFLELINDTDKKKWGDYSSKPQNKPNKIHIDTKIPLFFKLKKIENSSHLFQLQELQCGKMFSKCWNFYFRIELRSEVCIKELGVS